MPYILGRETTAPVVAEEPKSNDDNHALVHKFGPTLNSAPSARLLELLGADIFTDHGGDCKRMD